MAKVTHEFDLYGKHYVLETGELAKQATGAVLVKCGESTVLLTAVVSKERKDYDFFPLTVDFIEKMYAVGRIPGGYLKREARPSEKATLTARMIDRPLRPSFPAGFRNEVQVVATTLVADQVNPVDTICVMAASAALTVGGVPFEGPLACVRIGRDRETGEFIVNPTYEERDNSDLDLELGGASDFISMLEAGADEISEEDMLSAMAFGQEAIAAFCEEEKKFFAKVEEANGPIQQREYILDEPLPEVHDRIFAHYDEMEAALKDADKLSRIGKVEALKESIRTEFTEEEQAQWSRAIPVELKALEKHAMRLMVVETGERVDGRTPTEVRPLMVKPDYLPRVHGSGLFQRGQTQVLSVCTLGMLNEWQRLDTIEPVDGKRYIHHYNFPPFCTGETGRMGSPKRREIGHGNLAERALLPVIPSEDEFPYTIRVVSEVMESNGSSSMASTCGSTLALMDAGVPLKRPVSGVAMGLIQEAGKTVVLTDIQGLEDFLGDMDFKVTGTTKGITAMQMDNKATGLTPEILRSALMQAHEGRMFILDTMLDAIPAPREQRIARRSQEQEDLADTRAKLATATEDSAKLKKAIELLHAAQQRHKAADEQARLHARQAASALAEAERYSATARTRREAIPYKNAQELEKKHAETQRASETARAALTRAQADAQTLQKARDDERRASELLVQAQSEGAEARRREAALLAQAESADSSVSSARARLKYENKEQALRAIQDAQKQIDLFDATLARIRTSLGESEKELAAARGEADTLARSIREAPFYEKDQVEEEQRNAHDALEREERSLAEISAALSANEKTLEQVRLLAKKARAVEERYGEVATLADTANGRLVGKDKIAFETYVQSMYFDRMIAAANRRLRAMTNERYKLVRRRAAITKSGQSGLDLDVMDAYTGKMRDASSLSGGESFKAALALALGLSDVVQAHAGGVQLDTMFIDEGFGSLDQESLQLAVKTLTELSGGDKLIGIISHVDELKESIDRKIVVKRGRNGSSVSIEA